MNACPVIIVKSLWPRLMRTCTNYSQYVVSDTNKDFKFDLNRKLKSWLKFEPKFLTWLPNGKLEKTTVYLLFFLFIQFSAIEIRWSLFPLKACDKFITMTGKNGGLPLVVGELQPFFNWRSSNSKQIHHVFSMHMHKGELNDAINYVQKGCAMQMWGITLN